MMIEGDIALVRRCEYCNSEKQFLQFNLHYGAGYKGNFDVRGRPIPMKMFFNLLYDKIVEKLQARQELVELIN